MSQGEETGAATTTRRAEWRTPEVVELSTSLTANAPSGGGSDGGARPMTS